MSFVVPIDHHPSHFSLKGNDSAGSNDAARPAESTSEGRFALGIRGGFILPQNDLKLTTSQFPDFIVGGYGRFRLGNFQQLKPVGEWWSFSRGVQYSQLPSRNQTIRTDLQAVVIGSEYSCRLGGPLRQFALGGGPYLVRWSVDSTNSVTLASLGTALGSGNSQWTRFGGGLIGTYRLSRRLDLEGRWIHTSYGYEHLPVNVVTLGAGWTF